ncbi:VOC family protein [Streptomyces roseofulvus]|uniref:VOC family protein n=2 Tax=Streptomyces TaxID=1883 RepID=A0ABU4KHI5_9ACTN|nr:VOC family protein [Streptomyces roseolus]MDX2297221.1 VOC family protein [Streptomyces roseolus]
MASRLNPYISFTGKARQALDFYQEVFGGSPEVNTYAQFGQAPPGYEDKVMHGMLETPAGFTLMVSDNPPGMDHTVGNNISISLSGDDDTELRGYWDKLAARGTVSVPLEKQMWGDVFGMCTDEFGITWMVDIAGQPS